MGRRILGTLSTLFVSRYGRNGGRSRSLRVGAIGTGLAVVASGAAAIAPPAAGADVPSSWALSATVMPAATLPMEEPEDGSFETIPLPELSTETSTTRMLPSGEHEIDISQVPINYLDDDGTWLPIDTELVEPTEDSDSPQAPAEDYAAENAAASYTASIPADAEDTAARFAVEASGLPGGEAWVTLKLAGLQGAPALDGDTASFTQFGEDFAAGFDGASAVQLQTTGEGLKETIVLDSPPTEGPKGSVIDGDEGPGDEGPGDESSDGADDGEGDTQPGSGGNAEAAPEGGAAGGEQTGQATPSPGVGEATAGSQAFGFDYDLEVADGITPVLQTDGSIDFIRDAAPNQAPVFSIPLGNMYDSAETTQIGGIETPGPAYTNSIDYELTQTGSNGGSWTLRVVPDLDWLTDPAREYPVSIDPTITRGPTRDCTLFEDEPNSNRCGDSQTYLQVGQMSGGKNRRAVLKFDSSGIDPAARIDEANLELWLDTSQTTQTGPNINTNYVVRRTGKPFNTGAAWNTSGSNGAWTGGDPTGPNEGANLLNGLAANNGWRYFNITSIVEGWHTGTMPNDGLVVKQQSENVTNKLSFFSSSVNNPANRRPNLNITYTPAVGPQGGVRDYWQFEERELTDRITAKANIGNGNLHVDAKDFSVAGVAGWDMGFTRYYNSAQAQASANSNMGAGWSHSFGGSIRLEFPNGANDRSKLNFWGPSGYRVIFNQTGGSSSNQYKREEPGIDADLERDPSQNAYILTFFDESKYRFDLQGQLQSIRDTNQNALAFGYRTDNKLGSVTDTRGRVAVFSYNTAGLINQVSLRRPDGSDSTPGAEMLRYQYTYSQPGGELAQLRTSRLTVYNGNAIGNSSSDTTAADNNVSDGGSIGAITEYDYTDNGRLIEIRDARETATGAGGVTKFTYDNPTNRVNQIERVKQGGASSTVNFTYFQGAGADGATCESEKDNDAKFRTNVNGERTGIEDVTKYCIDNHARVLRTTDANNNKRSSSWTVNSNVDMAAMPGTGSGTAMYNYSYQGDDENATKAESPEGSTSGATYGSGSEHNPEAVQGDDSGGELNSWEYEYDDKDRVTEARAGNDDLNITYNYCWTEEGQIRRILPGTGFNGNETCTQAANGPQGDDTVFSYNAKNELLSVNRPSGGDQTFTYDNLSRIRTVTDGNGTRTRYCYDALDRVVRADHYDPANVNDANVNCGQNPPSGVQTVRWDYDLAGNLVELGNLTTPNKIFEYDDLNRLTSERPQNPSNRTDYNYDLAGNVIRTAVDSETSDGLEATLYTYDRLNRLESLDDQRPGNATITFGYDNQDNRTRTTFPILNSSGQVTSNPLVQRRIYDNDSQVRCEFSIRGNSLSNEINCDAVRGNGNLITYREYDYSNPDLEDIPSTDKDETRTSTKYGMIELGNKQTKYQYDPIKRLKKAVTRNGGANNDPILREFEYEYSERSNLTNELTGGTTPSLETGRLQMRYDNGDQICTSVRQLTDAPNLDCDPATTVPDQTTYSHNADGDLLSASGGGSQSLNGLQLDYNLPRQTTSITPPGMGPNTSHTGGTQAYDGVEQDRRTSAGNTNFSYGYAGDISAQKTTDQPAQLFVRDTSGNLLAMLTRDPNNAGQIRDTDYYLTDEQQSVIGTYDGRGRIAANEDDGNGMIRYLYEPFGQIIRTWTHPGAGTSNQDGSENGALQAPSSNMNPFTYVSGYHDRATGLIKFGTRYYMPSIGTWTQRDPKNGSMAQPLTLNAYNYAASNPCNNTDTSGRSIDCAFTVVGVVIAVYFSLSSAWALGTTGVFSAYGVASTCYGFSFDEAAEDSYYPYTDYYPAGGATGDSPYYYD
ncbi:DNRLRE domain-containing protein [uncultured Nocardioides sp.]|uniref:DNRLRE domain-containing protein n=1 Tax=uncultured Nocardioides sp. TaxID=198441 RepID=UPI002630EEDA|nr:DNRLRE domain-containing protein [uncultured Nocardioides sp.]